MNKYLLKTLSENWSLLLFRGILGILFGIFAFTMPKVTLYALVISWGIYAVLDGILAIVAAGKGGGPMPRWWLIFAGVCSLVAAVISFAWPDMTAIFLVLVIGWANIFRGVFEIFGAIALRKEVKNEWWLALSGLISFLFGCFIVWHPGEGALALIWAIAVAVMVAGFSLVMLAIQLKRIRSRNKKNSKG